MRPRPSLLPRPLPLTHPSNTPTTTTIPTPTQTRPLLPSPYPSLDHPHQQTHRLDFLLNGAPSFTRPVKAHPSLLFFLDKYNVPFFAGTPLS